MGIFDFLKKREFALIDELQAKLDKYKIVEDANTEATSIINKANKEYNDLINKGKREANDIVKDATDQKENLSKKIAELQEEVSKIETNISNLQRHKVDLLVEKDRLTQSIEKLKTQYSELSNSLNNEILIQEFGLYTPLYDFATSEEYKDQLQEIRLRQRKMITDNKCTYCFKPWTVDGSLAKGERMTKNWTKQMIRCFNNECDTLIDKVKFSNVNTYIDKIRKSAEILDKMGDFMGIKISIGYVNLKIEECRLAYEYAVKKQEEKEEQKRIREQLREEEKLQKELEQARKDIEKEQNHYNNALEKILNQLENCKDVDKNALEAKRNEIEGHLDKLNKSLEDIDYREANKRAGYVYIISNIGSFGENVYKIGMTRRLEPLERVNELGDASVPFKFDVHALIFSDDAPALESALHRAFENKKVNMVNPKREFFRVSIEDIMAVVKENYDKTVEYIKIPEAEQYRQSLKMYDIKNK